MTPLLMPFCAEAEVEDRKAEAAVDIQKPFPNSLCLKEARHRLLLVLVEQVENPEEMEVHRPLEVKQ